MVDEHHNIAIYIIGKLPTTYGFCRAASFSTLFFQGYEAHQNQGLSNNSNITSLSPCFWGQSLKKVDVCRGNIRACDSCCLLSRYNDKHDFKREEWGDQCTNEHKNKNDALDKGTSIYSLSNATDLIVPPKKDRTGSIYPYLLLF